MKKFKLEGKEPLSKEQMKQVRGGGDPDCPGGCCISDCAVQDQDPTLFDNGCCCGYQLCFQQDPEQYFCWSETELCPPFA